MENQSPDIQMSPAPASASAGLMNVLQQSFSTPALLQQHQQQTTNNAGQVHQQQKQQQQQQQQHQQQSSSGVIKKPTRKPYLKIIEQPAQKSLRFRYECEGRSAGSIPGVNSMPENKTFPTIEIVNYNKEAIVAVSCVTKDPPYRPHPHKVVGRDGGGQKFVDGICEVKLSGQPLRAVFSNLGIQCVKKKEIQKSLDLRKVRKLNPFNVPYTTKDQKIDYDLNAVRLCFQAFINPTGERWEPLEPQVSEPIHDRKGTSELVISQLCSCSGKVNGGDRIILLCEKVDRNDIKIRFSELDSERRVIWHAYADFQQQDIHKQTAIVFKTPRYIRSDISDAVKVYIQLERPSDNRLSEPREFEYYPDPDTLKRKRFRPDKFKEEMSMLMSLNAKQQQQQQFQTIQVPSKTSTANFSNFGSPSPIFNLPEFKAEPVNSPDHYGSQNSPYSMTHSPMSQQPQQSPTGNELQYTTLQPVANSTNPFLSPSGSSHGFVSPVNQLPIMSGGSFTLLRNTDSNQSLHQQQQNGNSFSFTPNIAPQDDISMENKMVSEIAHQLMAGIQTNASGTFTTLRNILSTSNEENSTETELPFMDNTYTEEGLTESGLLNELAGQQLIEIANLSVSDGT